MGRILVVDDEPDIVRVVVKIMQSHGHDVTTARDGEECLERVQGDPPDVIILDLNLPRMDGLEVCRRLKTQDATRHIPVVMMSAAYVSLSDAKRSSDVGADEWIIKPFMSEALVHNVERLLPRPRATSSPPAG